MGSKVIRHLCDYGVPDCVERPTGVLLEEESSTVGGDDESRSDSMCL